ncbi:MAG: zinc-ribbon domain-containing protein [Promethearchaeia archaeon]
MSDPDRKERNENEDPHREKATKKDSSEIRLEDLQPPPKPKIEMHQELGMKVCFNCGNMIEKDSPFCEHCGSPQ